METTTLRKLKKGEYFKIVKNGIPSKTVYVKDDYSYEARKFFVTKFSDIGDSRLLKGATIVTTDFIF